MDDIDKAVFWTMGLVLGLPLCGLLAFGILSWLSHSNIKYPIETIRKHEYVIKSIDSCWGGRVEQTCRVTLEGGRYYESLAVYRYRTRPQPGDKIFTELNVYKYSTMSRSCIVGPRTGAWWGHAKSCTSPGHCYWWMPCFTGMHGQDRGPAFDRFMEDRMGVLYLMALFVVGILTAIHMHKRRKYENA